MVGRIASLIVLLAIVGCGPRGETKTLDEVFLIAKDRFAKVSAVQMPEDVKSSISELVGILNQLAMSDASNTSQQLTQVATILSSLVGKSAYTARPAMGELMNQYRAIAASSEHSVGQLKLLVARTFSILASELETTRFAV